MYTRRVLLAYIYMLTCNNCWIFYRAYKITSKTTSEIMKFWYERISEYIRIKKRIRIWYKRIFVAENIRIYSNIRIFNTLWYEKYDTNEYPNIFGSKKWYERIYEYIRIKKRIRIWYERIFVAENIQIYSNIQIFVTLWSVSSGRTLLWILLCSLGTAQVRDTSGNWQKFLNLLCAGVVQSIGNIPHHSLVL